MRFNTHWLDIIYDVFDIACGLCWLLLAIFVVVFLAAATVCSAAKLAILFFG